MGHPLHRAAHVRPRLAGYVCGVVLACATAWACGRVGASERSTAGAKLQVSVQVVATCAVDTRASVHEAELQTAAQVTCRGAAAPAPAVSAPVSVSVDGTSQRYAVATLNF